MGNRSFEKFHRGREGDHAIACKQLDSSEYPKYEHLVFSGQRAKIRKRLGLDACFAIGAEAFGSPAGLALVNVAGSGREITGGIHTLHVDPRYRGKGIGNKLMDEVVTKAGKIGCRELWITYVRDYDWAPALERITAEKGFEQTQLHRLFTIQVTAPDLEKLVSHLKRLMRRRLELPQGYEVIPYGEMTDEMRCEIESGEGKWFEPILNPLSEAGRANQEKSILLLKNGSVAGWFILIDAGSDAVLYRNAFIRKECRGTGLFLHLLLRGVEWLCEGRKITRATLLTRGDNDNMLSTMKKCLSPCTYVIKTQVEKKKPL